MVLGKLFSHKKGDSNMWWIIIGAVIALVVLVVLLMIFTDRTRNLEEGLLSCESKGGYCVPEGTCRSIYEGSIAKVFDCPNPDSDKKPECCLRCKNGCESAL